MRGGYEAVVESGNFDGGWEGKLKTQLGEWLHWSWDKYGTDDSVNGPDPAFDLVERIRDWRLKRQD
jgi:hypothetical protein